MENVAKIISVIIGLGLLNVWLLRFNKPTNWRGGRAKNMKEEFGVYGLPSYVLYSVGFVKVTIGLLLIMSIWLPQFVTHASTIVLSILMLCAVLMHLKVKDPIGKSLPAFLLLSFSVVVVVLTLPQA
jgi:hypothetical protein